MPEIFPFIPSTSIEITADGDLEISQDDDNSTRVWIPSILIPAFLEKLKEIIEREGAK